jgi:hypothetical protein
VWEAFLERASAPEEQRVVDCFRKTVLASHLRYKKGILLVPFLVSENGFLLVKEIPEGILLVQNQYS